MKQTTPTTGEFRRRIPIVPIAVAVIGFVGAGLLWLVLARHQTMTLATETAQTAQSVQHALQNFLAVRVGPAISLGKRLTDRDSQDRIVTFSRDATTDFAAIPGYVASVWLDADGTVVVVSGNVPQLAALIGKSFAFTTMKTSTPSNIPPN